MAVERGLSMAGAAVGSGVAVGIGAAGEQAVTIPHSTTNKRKNFLKGDRME
jgi:ABC-type tungstate transport system permease subunit